MLDNIGALLLTKNMSDDRVKEIVEDIQKEMDERLSEPPGQTMSPQIQNVGGRQNKSRPGKPFKSLLTPAEPDLRDEPDPTDPKTMHSKVTTKFPG